MMSRRSSTLSLVRTLISHLSGFFPGKAPRAILAAQPVVPAADLQHLPGLVADLFEHQAIRGGLRRVPLDADHRAGAQMRRMAIGWLMGELLLDELLDRRTARVVPGARVQRGVGRELL